MKWAESGSHRHRAPDLAHQVHAHRVAPEREKGAVTKAQDAAIAPHQIECDGENSVAEIFADERHGIRRHMEGRAFGNDPCRKRNDDGQCSEQRKHDRHRRTEIVAAKELAMTL